MKGVLGVVVSVVLVTPAAACRLRRHRHRQAGRGAVHKNYPEKSESHPPPVLSRLPAALKSTRCGEMCTCRAGVDVGVIGAD